MSIYALKPKFQNLLRPLVRQLAAKGVTANQVTLIACLLSILLGVVLALFPTFSFLFFLIPIWLFLRMALNAIDGMLAREIKKKSRLGGYLNEITDVVSDAALYLPFAFVAPFDGIQISSIIWLAALSELCGILGQVQGKMRRYDGPMGKSDRAFLFGVIGLLYAVNGSFLHSLFWWVANIVIILLIVTCIKRVKNGLAEVTE